MTDNALRLIEDLVKHWTDRKLAIIAVANKLLKRIFGVVKNECLFDRNYYKKIAWFIWISAQFVLAVVLSTVWKQFCHW